MVGTAQEPGLTLAEIADIAGGQVEDRWAAVRVTSGAIGSQDVQPGGLFFGVPGLRVHGAKYAPSSQAAAVLTDVSGGELLSIEAPDMPVVVVNNMRAVMGKVAAALYGHPSRDMTVVGITGTSGKTTTSYLVERALMMAGLDGSENGPAHVGIIGTTGTRINGRAIPTKLTTPEAPTMQALLAQMRDEGVTHVVMEVSSHALELGRVQGIEFDVVAFTNLSQDHLDFHPTMDDYFRAKSTLFTTCTAASQSQTGRAARAVVCIDDAWGQQMADVAIQAGLELTTVHTGALQHRAGSSGSNDSTQQQPELFALHSSWSATSVQVNPNGQQVITAEIDGEEHTVHISLAGQFNVANALVAVACATAAGVDLQSAIEAIVDVQVPGRMQAIDAGQDFLAMVDYAHKPGAVAAVLASLREYLPNASDRIGIVIGAGGDRDQEKRPAMGYEAARVADAVFVTDDNPRSEDPSTIRAAVLEGAHRAASEAKAEGREVLVLEFADRRAAIQAAITWATTGDAVVVAGKGHEQGQEIAGTVHPFYDVDEVADALNQRCAGKGA